MATQLAEIAELLESSPEYRVLRMFHERETYGELAFPFKTGLIVDVEATGLNTDEDKITQFAGVRFQFNAKGDVGRVLNAYASLEDPGIPIPPEVVEKTRISDERVRGHRIDDRLVAALLADVDVVIAHNADYDRKMIERRFRGFDQVAWGCSQRDVEWNAFDCQYIGLEYLLMKACGEFFLPHDALDDCRVALHLLAAPRAEDRSPLAHLIDAVARPTVRLWAHGSPFRTKDRLRLRRFRWNGEARCWFKDVKPSELEAEREWLLYNVYAGSLLLAEDAYTTAITALDRFSVRAV